MLNIDKVVDGVLSESSLDESSEVKVTTLVTTCPPDCHGYTGEGHICQQCKEADKVREKRREEGEKHQRNERIEKPWRFETQKPLTEPPDINYRETIITDQKTIDRLFEDENLHFTERCLRYQTQDVWVEDYILAEYERWTIYMLQDAKNGGNKAREKYFQQLYEAVGKDRKKVYYEWQQLDDEKDERELQAVAQRLGIPANHEDWTTEDKRRYVDSDEWVDEWPWVVDIRESLEQEDQAKSTSTSKDTEAQGSNRGNSLPQKDNEDNSQRPHIPDKDIELSSSAPNPDSHLPEQETENFGAALHTKSQLEPSSSELHSPLNIELQPQRGTSYYRAFTTLLFTLLLYELVKQKLRL